jgi:hypothetical protein
MRNNQLHTLAALPLRKKELQIPIQYEAGWAKKSDWMLSTKEKSCTAENGRRVFNHVVCHYRNGVTLTPDR